MADFEQVFVDNREYIFKYLARLSRNVSLAEELTQETLFRAYMNMEIYWRNDDWLVINGVDHLFG